MERKAVEILKRIAYEQTREILNTKYYHPPKEISEWRKRFYVGLKQAYLECKKLHQGEAV